MVIYGYSMETIFSDQLVQWLNERNMSQADLAKHTKISPAEISRIMSGERKTPGLETIVLIAKALRLAPEIVFRAAAGISTPPHMWITIISSLPASSNTWAM